MAQQQNGKNMDLTMDAASVYREEVFTDRKVGTIRCLIPVKADGAPDPGRPSIYVGDAQRLAEENEKTGHAGSAVNGE
jgi:hypothetical protein